MPSSIRALADAPSLWDQPCTAPNSSVWGFRGRFDPLPFLNNNQITDPSPIRAISWRTIAERVGLVALPTLLIAGGIAGSVLLGVFVPKLIPGMCLAVPLFLTPGIVAWIWVDYKGLESSDSIRKDFAANWESHTPIQLAFAEKSLLRHSSSEETLILGEIRTHLNGLKKKLTSMRSDFILGVDQSDAAIAALHSNMKEEVVSHLRKLAANCDSWEAVSKLQNQEARVKLFAEHLAPFFLQVIADLGTNAFFYQGKEEIHWRGVTFLARLDGGEVYGWAENTIRAEQKKWSDTLDKVLATPDRHNTYTSVIDTLFGMPKDIELIVVASAPPWEAPTSTRST